MAQSSRQAGTPKLELQPGRDGTALELTERQQLLIRLQHPDAARVVVMELHGGASAAALERPSRRVLQTVGLNGSGQPEEPTLTKLDAAAELVEEVARHDAVAEASADCPVVWVDSEDPLFVLYTSGSTGKPKGV